MVRKILKDVWAAKQGKLAFVALDWAKAFDSISPSALKKAMLRFGVPAHFANIVGAIYSDRRFFVKDAGEKSTMHRQTFGISQGCPLSPFLFSILVSALLHDAKVLFKEKGYGQFSDQFLANELVYADDTLIFDTDARVVENYMTCIQDVAAEYGLTFNISKLESLLVRLPEEK